MFDGAPVLGQDWSQLEEVESVGAVLLTPYKYNKNLLRHMRPGILDNTDPQGLTDALVKAFSAQETSSQDTNPRTFIVHPQDIQKLIDDQQLELTNPQMRALDIAFADYDQLKEAASQSHNNRVFFRLQEPGYRTLDEGWHPDSGVERRVLIRYSGLGVQEVHNDDVLSIRGFDVKVRDNARILTVPNGDVVAHKANELIPLEWSWKPPFIRKKSIPAIHRKQLAEDQSSLVLIAETDVTP